MGKAPAKKSSTKPAKPAAKKSTKPAAKAVSKAKAPAKSSATPVVKASAPPSSKSKAKTVEKPSPKVTAKPVVAKAEPKKEAKKSKVESVPEAVKVVTAAVEVKEKPAMMSSRGKSEESEASESADLKMVEGKKSKKEKDWSQIDRTAEIGPQWERIHDACKGLKPEPYKMSENFEAKTAITHKVLGWGYVLTSQNNRLEVIFKDGIKVLIANYKA